MVSSTATLALPAALETLRSTPCPTGRILSVYLDTSPSRVSGRAFLIALGAACQELRTIAPDAEHDLLDAAIAQAVTYTRDVFQAHAAGLALFASGAETYFFAVPLPTRAGDRVAWDSRPHIEPLVAALDNAERIAVALVDKERTRLYTVFLGEIEEQRFIEDSVPGEQATGGWFALAQGRYARHREDHVLRHMNRSHTELMAMLQRKPFDRLFLGGPPEALSLFQRRLPRPLMARLAGSLSLELFASETEVLAATLREAEAIERREEASNLAALLESVNTRRATAGLEPTLEALHEGRVYTLLVADTLHLAGGECPQCHRLTTAPRCPACGQTVDAASDLRELAVQNALAQAAKVDEVSGEAAARLTEVGGMAAWTRF